MGEPACAGCQALQRWAPDDNFGQARPPPCLDHLLRRGAGLLETATRGAVRFPRRVRELRYAGLGLRDRHAAGQVRDHGLAVARGRLVQAVAPAVFPPKSHEGNDRFAQPVWDHFGRRFTFLREPGPDGTRGRAGRASRFGVIRRQVWGGHRTRAGAHAQSVGMAVRRTCWQPGRSALDFLGPWRRGQPVASAQPPGAGPPLPKASAIRLQPHVPPPPARTTR